MLAIHFRCWNICYFSLPSLWKKKGKLCVTFVWLYTHSWANRGKTVISWGHSEHLSQWLDFVWLDGFTMCCSQMPCLLHTLLPVASRASGANQILKSIIKFLHVLYIVSIKCCNLWENALQGVEIDLNAKVIFNEQLDEGRLFDWLVDNLLACLLILSDGAVRLPEEVKCCIWPWHFKYLWSLPCPSFYKPFLAADISFSS